jgi:hypothetical protein
MARRLPGIAKKYRKRYRNNFHFFSIPQVSRCTHMSRRYTTCVPEVTVSEMKGFTWGLIGLGYGCDSRVCSWEVFEDMPLGVLKWRGGLRGVSSECCEPVNGVARSLNVDCGNRVVVEISDCNGSGDWLIDCGHWSCRRRWKNHLWNRQGTFVIQFDFYILGYILKGGETQLSKLHILTKFDKILFSLLNIFLGESCVKYIVNSRPKNSWMLYGSLRFSHFSP